MSAMPSPAESRARSPVPAGAVTPAMEPSENPHIAEIDVESVLFDVSAAAQAFPGQIDRRTPMQMDGTLINSSPAVVKAWNLFAQTYPLDLEDILRCESSPICWLHAMLTSAPQLPTVCEPSTFCANGARSRTPSCSKPKLSDSSRLFLLLPSPQPLKVVPVLKSCPESRSCWTT